MLRGEMHSVRLDTMAEIETINLRDFAHDNRGSVDDRPYGGGDGMVMRADCLARAVQSIEGEKHIVLTSPRGTQWTQKKAEEYSRIEKNIVFILVVFYNIVYNYIQ